MTKRLKGQTVSSSGVGGQIGFPTVNIVYVGDDLGVFVGRVFVGDEEYQAAVNVGGRPTVDEKHYCEVYLLDFEGDIDEGTEIEVELIEKIRDICKFDNLDELKERIAGDVEFVKNWYNRPEPN